MEPPRDWARRSRPRAAGWEKGQVENQVGLVPFLTPRLRVKSYDELNAWLLDKSIAYAKAHAHPERPDRTVWEVFEEEPPKLVAYRGLSACAFRPSSTGARPIMAWPDGCSSPDYVASSGMGPATGIAVA